MIIRNQHEFEERIGLIRDLEVLEKLGAPTPCEPTGMYQTTRLGELYEFLRGHPALHIATLTDDSDAIEGDLENAVRLDDEDKSEGRLFWVTTMDNKVRIVNRQGYFLCQGEADPDLYLIEVEMT